MRPGWFNVELHYGTILGWTPYVHYTTPYSSYTVYANLLDRFLKIVGKSEEEIVVQGKGLNTGFSTEVQ